MSFLDYSSIKDEQDTNFPMDVNLPKYETSGKMGRLMHPTFLPLIHLILLIARFLCHPKKTTKSSRFVLLKSLITMKKSQQNTLVTPSSYVQLMMINAKILCHTTTLSIPLQTKRMKILCVDSNLLLPIRYRLMTPIPTKKYLVIMCWLNEKQGILPQSPSLSFHKITLSHVLCMMMRKNVTTGDM